MESAVVAIAATIDATTDATVDAELAASSNEAGNVTQQSVEGLVELGRAARREVPRANHAQWSAPADRPDPIAILEAQNEDRLPWLVPIRHARMGVNPFTFYRGAAAIMASDLVGTPSSGLHVQLGGDAHLSNFGAYASPERQLVVDANDFDETLVGPWEWDLKRLATSFTIAGQYLGFSKDDCRRATSRVTHAYRKAMGEFAGMGFLELWNQSIRVEDIRAAAGMSPQELEKRIDRFRRRAQKKTSLQAVGKLAVSIDGKYRIRSQPPVVFPLRDLPQGYDVDAIEAAAKEAFENYKATLDDARHHLIDRYRLVDVGMKVVGVGSAGTRCLILLLEGRNERDPLFLQAKEAGRSVLEESLQPSPYPNHGQRIVEGQRLVQAESDIFLGWTEGRIDGRHFYIRQLRDWKGSVEIEGATPDQLRFYADLCGRILARGHARSGESVAMRAYCGGSDRLDRAITEFADAYAAQNLEDFGRFRDAIDAGRLEAADVA
jgi:uncharacterized protein (DUF2252 family)